MLVALVSVLVAAIGPAILLEVSGRERAASWTPRRMRRTGGDAEDTTR